MLWAATIVFVFLQKQVGEQCELRLTAEKRLSALQTNMDKKKEKEQKEMLGESLSEHFFLLFFLLFVHIRSPIFV